MRLQVKQEVFSPAGDRFNDTMNECLMPIGGGIWPDQVSGEILARPQFVCWPIEGPGGEQAPQLLAIPASGEGDGSIRERGLPVFQSSYRLWSYRGFASVLIVSMPNQRNATKPK